MIDKDESHELVVFVGFFLNKSFSVPVALELLKMAIEKAGYPDKIIIGMDVAASEFFRGGKYDLDFKSPDDPSRHISGEKLGDLYRDFIKNYPGKHNTPPQPHL